MKPAPSGRYKEKKIAPKFDLLSNFVASQQLKSDFLLYSLLRNLEVSLKYRIFAPENNKLRLCVQ